MDRILLMQDQFLITLPNQLATTIRIRQLTAKTLMVVPKRECRVDRFFDPSAFVFLSDSSKVAS
jgi:hypothetical protein